MLLFHLASGRGQWKGKSRQRGHLYLFRKRLRGLLEQLGKEGKTYQSLFSDTRLKWMPTSWLETTANRDNRMLRRVRLWMRKNASRVFELLMGNDVAPRKDFITQGSGLASERIDA